MTTSDDLTPTFVLSELDRETRGEPAAAPDAHVELDETDQDPADLDGLVLGDDPA